MQKNNFHILRLIFSTFVIFSHAYALTGLAEPLIYNRPYGNFAVHCFFVLSGYLISISYIKSTGFFSFTKKRVLRILPAFVVSIFFAKAIASLCGHYVNNPVPYIVNGPVWTLSYEIFCYLCCGLLGFFGLLCASSINVLYIISLFTIIIFRETSTPFISVIAPMLFCFLSGAFVLLNEEKLHLKYSGPFSLGILIVMVFINSENIGSSIRILPFIFGPELTNHFIYYMLYLFALPLSLIYIAKYFPIRLPMKTDLSYGVYIYAWPIQQGIIFYFLKKNININPIAMFFLTMSITYFVSFFSWRYVEKPFIQMKNIDITKHLKKGYLYLKKK